MTVYDQLASTDEGQRRLSRARLRYRVLGSLHSSLKQSGLNKTQIAARLGIRKSAVSQVFGGDGNLRVNTIADYFAAMGQEVELQFVPIGTARDRATGSLPRLDLVWNQGRALTPIRHGGRVRPDTVRPWREQTSSADKCETLTVAHA